MTYKFSYIFPEMDSITRQEAAVYRCIEKKLSYLQLDNAYILPSKDLWRDGKCYGGVVSCEGEFIESSAWHEGKRCDKYSFEGNEATEREETAIYMGFWNPCWGHAITDNLKKLWFLETADCQLLLNEGAKLVYLTIDNRPLPAYIHRIFQLANVDIDSFELISSLSRFKRIIIPDNSFIADNGQRYYTMEFSETIKRIKQNAEVQKVIYPEKVYFTRTRLQNNRDIGEKAIERVFRQQGYSIIAPEQHSVDDQIQMMMHCRSFASTEGSISHNAVFCNPGTDVIIIRKCNDVNKYQMAVNEVSGANITYIDCHHSTRTPKTTPWVGPFFLYNNECLKKWSGDTTYKLPLIFNPKWWHYCLLGHGWYSRIINRIESIF